MLNIATFADGIIETLCIFKQRFQDFDFSVPWKLMKNINFPNRFNIFGPNCRLLKNSSKNQFIFIMLFMFFLFYYFYFLRLSKGDFISDRETLVELHSTYKWWLLLIIVWTSPLMSAICNKDVDEIFWYLHYRSLILSMDLRVSWKCSGDFPTPFVCYLTFNLCFYNLELDFTFYQSEIQFFLMFLLNYFLKCIMEITISNYMNYTNERLMKN
jgi:hypothetical protein